MTKIAIVWFRNDLRIRDNETLSTALREVDEIIPIYCFDPRHFTKTENYNFPKFSQNKINFLIQSISDLRFKLKELGGNLIIRYGKPEDKVFELAQKFNATAVYCQEEICSEEIKVEQLLEDKLNTIKVSMEYFWGKTLINFDDLPFAIENLPDIFTKFRNKIESNLQIREEFLSPDVINFVKGVEPGEIPSVATLGIESSDETISNLYKGGETAGLLRLKYYLWETGLIENYKETRNQLLGKDYSSKLSLWLAFGCVSPRTIYWEIFNYEKEQVKNESTYWMIFELLWRDYFNFVAVKYGDLIFKNGGIKKKVLNYKSNNKSLKAWINGQTGIPFIDANMRELKKTGFMSNRGRQNVASFLVKDLKLDWLAGAEYFESTLIDYDPCSNYGNWNYIAGIGNDPREDRYFNVLTQAKRYDKFGDYVRFWVPEISNLPSTRIQEPYLLKQAEQEYLKVRLGTDYPSPCFNIFTWKAKQ